MQHFSLQTRQSNVRKVTLKRVSLASTGIYRCEVTSKLKPAGIDSEVREDRMVVLGELLLRDNQNPSSTNGY